jgi:YHS domain-containing protein
MPLPTLNGGIAMTNIATSSKDSPTQVVDPVCGMTVEPGQTQFVSVHEGRRYWFCAEACRKAFEKNPKKYLVPKSSNKKGWFARYWERMAKVNEKELGCGGAKCH